MSEDWKACLIGSVVVLVMLFFCGIGHCAPSISATIGTWAHDNSCTISGSSFGSKSPAAPLIWDNCEGNTENLQSEITGKAWTEALPNIAGSPFDIVYRNYPWAGISAPHGYSTQCMAGAHHYTGDPTTMMGYNGLNVCVTIPTSSSNIMYVTWYSHMGENWPTDNDVTCGGPNFKDTCVQTGASTAYTGSFSYSTYDNAHNPADIGDTCYLRNHGRDVCGIARATVNLKNPRLHWVRMEEGRRTGTSNVIFFKRSNRATDGVLIPGYDIDEAVCSYGFQFNSITVGGFYRKEYFPPSCNTVGKVTVTDNNAIRLFDDIYVDNTFSRVMLGDSSTYASCTILEPQIPSAWAAGEVTVTVNRAALSSSTAYLYVFDSANARNTNGYEITFGAGDTTTTTTVSATTSSSSTTSSIALTTTTSIQDEESSTGDVWWVSIDDGSSNYSGSSPTIYMTADDGHVSDSNVFSSSFGFTADMVDEYIYIVDRGRYKISAVVEDGELMLSAQPSTGSDLRFTIGGPNKSWTELP